MSDRDVTGSVRAQLSEVASIFRAFWTLHTRIQAMGRHIYFYFYYNNGNHCFYYFYYNYIY